LLILSTANQRPQTHPPTHRYGAHPLKCDLLLPFRKPVDLLPLSVNTSVKSPEFYQFPDREIYNHVEMHLTPRALVKKTDTKRMTALAKTTSPTKFEWTGFEPHK